ncbi:hypothetical protein F4810DRAFT_714559 [Camillea tinctor]|nr:hypothetical protein F4810DRAFT_714559 [Camillea tinctor]
MLFPSFNHLQFMAALAFLVLSFVPTVLADLAKKYGISLELFFLLNPLLDPDCSSIQAGKDYCVAGTVLDTTPDGTCGPNSGVSCLGYSGGQCCNSQTGICGGTREDCQTGICSSGLCEVKDPASYSLDGQCGPANGKKCGGIWGSCCNTEGRCGDGDGFCDSGNCWSGNCTIVFPSAPDPTEQPVWETGNSTNGLCGAENDNQICNVFWGYCCASTGRCGDGVAFCGSGCQGKYGNCTTSSGAISPDGTCGGANEYVCVGSSFGGCCSQGGWCGSTSEYCEAGCQPEYGNCTGTGNISPDGTCGGTNGYTCEGSAFGDCYFGKCN